MNISLRPWTQDDARDYADMMLRVDFTYDDEELRCTNYENAVTEIATMDKEERLDGHTHRAILLDGKVVGKAQVVRLSEVRDCDGLIGCLLVREVTGKGVGTEALRQLATTAFTLYDYERLTGIIYGPNRASVRMAEKVGFKHEATLRQAVWKDGYVYHALVYGLLREDTGIPSPPPHYAM